MITWAGRWPACCRTAISSGSREASDWREPWAGWHRTRYEEKAIREGRVPSYLRFLKRGA